MVASLAKAVIGSNAAKKSASQQAEGANQAANEQRSQYDQSRTDILGQKDQNRTDLNPFLTTGTSANNQLGYLMGLGGTGTGTAGSLAKPFTMADYEADPGYAFRLAEGQKALARTQAAGGKYFSGGAIKSLTDYNQNSASNEYQSAYERFNTNQNNLYNRLAGLSTSGQSAANTLIGANNSLTGALADLGANKATNVGNDIMGAANAHAAGTVGSAQAWQTGIQEADNKGQEAGKMASKWFGG